MDWFSSSIRYKNYNTNFLINFVKKRRRRTYERKILKQIAIQFQMHWQQVPEWNCWAYKEDESKGERKKSRHTMEYLMARNIGEKCKLPLAAKRLKTRVISGQGSRRVASGSSRLPSRFHRCTPNFRKITRLGWIVQIFETSFFLRETKRTCHRNKFYSKKYLFNRSDRIRSFNQGRCINQGESLPPTIISRKSR